MASRKRDTYQIEPRTCVLFRRCLNWTMNGKSLQFLVITNVLGYHIGQMDGKVSAKNIKNIEITVA